MNMGLEVGASLDGENLINAVWAVVSTLQREDGYLARYAHLMDMSKPGCIAVNAKGERFGNEASVHFVEAMHKTGSVPAYIINDAAGVKKYGLGMVHPGALNLKQLRQEGYENAGNTLRSPPHQIGVKPRATRSNMTHLKK